MGYSTHSVVELVIYTKVVRYAVNDMALYILIIIICKHFKIIQNEVWNVIDIK